MNRAAAVRQWLLSLGPLRRLASRRRRQHNEARFASGGWEYLRGLSEAGRYSIIAGYIQHFAPRGRVLDLGCGQGILAERIAHLPVAAYCGVDFAAGAIAQAPAGLDARFRFLQADIDRLEDPGPYDVVVFNESLYYLSRPIDTLHRYGARLGTSGIFVVSVYSDPEHDRLWERIGAQLRCLDHTQITNAAGARWWCGVFVPTAPDEPASQT